MRQIIATLIRFYQLTFSVIFGRHCRFHPTCSAYTREAVLTHGAGKGLWLGLKRLARCGPFGGSRFQGEFDPVPHPCHKHPNDKTN